MLRLDGVKMRRLVIIIIHGNDDAEELADAWHGRLSNSIVIESQEARSRDEDMVVRAIRRAVIPLATLIRCSISCGLGTAPGANARRCSTWRSRLKSDPLHRWRVRIDQRSYGI